MHFSVITPTHNRRDFLPEAVASVRATVSAPLDFSFDHLICENASTDDTADWLREASAQEGVPLRVRHQATKLLPGPARNLLIRQDAPADGWIVPLDDDDLLLQRTLLHYAQQIEQHPGRPWLVADFLRVDQDRRYLPGEDYYAWQFDSPTDMLRAIFRAEHFIQGNVCYSRELFEEVGGYDEQIEMAEDLDLYVRFLLAGHQPVICPHISHLHRFHTSNVSIGVDADKHGQDLRVIYDKYAAQLRELGIERP
ncbi:glycosyltransferase involved in cell wall biosynthesis [Hymenobacter luteus]|uniref:Glycosyltransferase involved in cell wall biosynthesis n=2 Tax=Hymenobacter TaxID=89966 RepID=A0A7W9T1M0_9BACT|nr:MULTISPECIES: glycosyltransferase [Hymenobacter]MBB4601711.1 glycosyltransferase involved in cell wall biosynthesis [Hymenobacter latericoloratus]MBB6059860.1 glycosyltransferase involved in cell wall biosynthesis [Hymenobacter luteus]